MFRAALALVSSLVGIGGYLVCSQPDCKDPGFLTVEVGHLQGDTFVPVRVEALEYSVASDPRSEVDDPDYIDPQLRQVFAADCLDEGCTQWRAAPGESGEITVRGKLCGETFETVALVDRDMDGCNYGDATVQLEVDPSACDASSTDP